MIKASALYMAIIIALVIGLICAALVSVAFYFDAEFQKAQRFDQLLNNANSGINMLLISDDSTYSFPKVVSLFGNEQDSVSLHRLHWGIYDIGISIAFRQKDSLTKVFSIADRVDSTKWAALYLMDEQRPFSVSGKTTIKGDAYIPHAGVKAAYVNFNAYQGDKRLIIGTIHFSDQVLPPLNAARLAYLENIYEQDQAATGIIKDSVNRSFTQAPVSFKLSKQMMNLDHKNLKGNCMVFSDTTLIIDSTTSLTNVVVVARSITIKKGFHGNAQFFAVDSINVDSNCRFEYPSAFGVIRQQAEKVYIRPIISIGKNTKINGVIFTYDKTQNPVQPLIVINSGALVKGQIYSQGQLQLADRSEIDGSVFTSRFLYKNGYTLYENYLINTTINSTALSRYYLTSDLLPVSKDQNKILQWLEVK